MPLFRTLTGALLGLILTASGVQAAGSPSQMFRCLRGELDAGLPHTREMPADETSQVFHIEDSPTRANPTLASARDKFLASRKLTKEEGALLEADVAALKKKVIQKDSLTAEETEILKKDEDSWGSFDDVWDEEKVEDVSQVTFRLSDPNAGPGDGGMKTFGLRSTDADAMEEAAINAGVIRPVDNASSSIFDEINLKSRPGYKPPSDPKKAANLIDLAPPELRNQFRQGQIQPLTVPLTVSGGHDGLSIFVWTEGGVERIGIGSSRGPGPVAIVKDHDALTLYREAVDKWRAKITQTPTHMMLSPAGDRLRRNVGKDAGSLYALNQARRGLEKSLAGAEAGYEAAVRTGELRAITAIEGRIQMAKRTLERWMRDNQKRLTELHTILMPKRRALAYEYRAMALNFKRLVADAKALGPTNSRGIADARRFRDLAVRYYKMGQQELAESNRDGQAILDLNFEALTSESDEVSDIVRKPASTPEIPDAFDPAFNDPELAPPGKK